MPLSNKSMSVRGGLWRVVAGTGSVILALKMADAVDKGTLPRHWSTVGAYGWVVVMIGLMFFGVGSLVQVIRPLMGDDEVRWFPKRGASGELWRVLGVGVPLVLGVVAINLLWPSLGGRAAVAAVGLFILFLVITQAGVLWDNPQVEGWRQFFGDNVVRLIYVVVALAFIAVALVGHL